MSFEKQLSLPLVGAQEQLSLPLSTKTQEDPFFNKREEDDADYPDALRKKESEDEDVNPEDDGVYDEDGFYTR